MKNYVRNTLVAIAALGVSAVSHNAEAQVDLSVGAGISKSKGENPSMTYYVRPSRAFSLGDIGKLPFTFIAEPEIGFSVMDGESSNYIGFNTYLETTLRKIDLGIGSYNSVENPWLKGGKSYLFSPHVYVKTNIGRDWSVAPTPCLDIATDGKNKKMSPALLCYITKRWKKYSVTVTPKVGKDWKGIEVTLGI